MPSQVQIDSTDRTLGLKDVTAVLMKLEWERRLLAAMLARKPSPMLNKGWEDDPLAACFAAINAASTAWSVVDWIWNEAEMTDGGTARLQSVLGVPLPSGKKSFALHLRANPCLDACHQIANATKHRALKSAVVTQGFRAEPVYDMFVDGDNQIHMTVSMTLARPGEPGETIVQDVSSMLHEAHEILESLVDAIVQSRAASV